MMTKGLPAALADLLQRYRWTHRAGAERGPECTNEQLAGKILDLVRESGYGSTLSDVWKRGLLPWSFCPLCGYECPRSLTGHEEGCPGAKLPWRVEV